MVNDLNRAEWFIIDWWWLCVDLICRDSVCKLLRLISSFQMFNVWRQSCKTEMRQSSEYRSSQRKQYRVCRSATPLKKPSWGTTWPDWSENWSNSGLLHKRTENKHCWCCYIYHRSNYSGKFIWNNILMMIINIMMSDEILSMWTTKLLKTDNYFVVCALRETYRTIMCRMVCCRMFCYNTSCISMFVLKLHFVLHRGEQAVAEAPPNLYKGSLCDVQKRIHALTMQLCKHGSCLNIFNFMQKHMVYYMCVSVFMSDQRAAWRERTQTSSEGRPNWRLQSAQCRVGKRVEVNDEEQSLKLVWIKLDELINAATLPSTEVYFEMVSSMIHWFHLPPFEGLKS